VPFQSPRLFRASQLDLLPLPESARFVRAVRGQVSLLFMGLPPTIQIASLGMADSLILMVLALVVFGPRRLPQIGRQIGKLMYEFRKASNDFKYQMEEEMRNAEESDRRKKEEERLKALAVAAPTVVDSQVSEANPHPSDEDLSPGTPRPGPPPEVPPAADSPYPSPYPNEAVYPEVTVPAVEASAEQPYPRIQPPSTGEPVPWSLKEELAKLSDVAFDTGVVAESSAGADAIPPETTPAAEQASHG